MCLRWRDCCRSVASYKGTRQQPSNTLMPAFATIAPRMIRSGASTACAGSRQAGGTWCALAGRMLGTDIAATVTPQKLGFNLRVRFTCFCLQNNQGGIVIGKREPAFWPEKHGISCKSGSHPRPLWLGAPSMCICMNAALPIVV